MKNANRRVYHVFLEKNRPTDLSVALHTMHGNQVGDVPFYIRCYTKEQLTKVLHQHEMFQINYVKKGRCYHYIDQKESEVAKGDILIIPPYVPHQLSCKDDENFEIYEIEFLTDFVIQNITDFEYIQSLFDFAYLEPFFMEEGQIRTCYHLPVEYQKKAESIMEELMNEYKDRDQSSLLMIKGLLLQLLVLFQRFINNRGTAQQKNPGLLESMEKAIAFVDSHFSENITSQDAAQVAAFSKSYFGYMFKMATHQTFVEYLNQRRIEAALQMLNEPHKRIIDICYDCGFKNVSHFNRTFKNTIGVSPTEYRSILAGRNKEDSE